MAEAPSSLSVAKAVRGLLSSGTSRLEASTLYAALSNPELMNGKNGSLSESVWNDLSSLSTPESCQAFAPVAVSIEIYNGRVSALKPAWKEIQTSAGEELSPPTGTMRRWPSLNAQLHLISTWYGYSLYIPASAFPVLEMEKASKTGEVNTKYTPSIEALSKLKGFPPGPLNGLVAKVTKSTAELKDLAQGAAVGTIISATWVAPHAIVSRPWTSFEESLSSSVDVIVPAPATPLKQQPVNFAFPGEQNENPSRDEYRPSHHRSNSSPLSTIQNSRPLPATPPFTPSPSQRKPRRSFFGLVRRPSTPSSPSVAEPLERIASFKESQNQVVPVSTQATSSDSAAPAAPSLVTSTATSNAGTGVAAATGINSAAAATATHGPTLSPDDSFTSTSSSSMPASGGGSNTKDLSQTINGAANFQVSGSFSLLKLGFGGGRRSREAERQAAYEREQAAKRQERLALMLAASKAAVCGGGVAVAVPGTSASASFSASAAGESAEAEAEQGETTKGGPGGPDDDPDLKAQVKSTSNSVTKASKAGKKLHFSKGSIQSQFIKEDDEAEGASAASSKGDSITRTTVTTVTTTDVERIASPKPDSVQAAFQSPVVNVSTT